jgi:tetratricopeptide (TPR) repeat protein
MKKEELDRSLIDFLKSLAAWITSLIGFLTSTVAFAQLLAGNIGVFVIVTLFLGSIIILTSFAYIYFKKRRSSLLIGTPLPAYSKRARRFALIGIITIPILFASGFGVWKYSQSHPSEKLIILVADFKGPEQEKYIVTETILDHLRQATRKYHEVQVIALGKSISAQEGNEVAREMGRLSHASIVLWGWYAPSEERVLVTVYFEVLARPRLLPLDIERRTLNAAVSELKNFKIQVMLSGEMSYLTLLTIGMIRYEARDYDGAIERFNEALEQTAIPIQMTDPSAIYFYRGKAYEAKADYDSAIANFDKAITLNPNLPEAYNNRGIIYSIKGAYDFAIIDFNKAIELDPNDAAAYNNRGNAFADKGEIDRAIADYDKSIELDPNDVTANYNRAGTYYKKEDYDRMIADYTRVISTNPSDAEAYYNRAFALGQKRAYEKAIEDYDKAIQIRPNYAEAYCYRGQSYSDRNKYNQAIADFEKAIRLKPNYALAYLFRGEAYFENGDIENGVASFNKAIELSDDASFKMRADLMLKIQIALHDKQ